jgi:DNA-binding IclR family transcriptional regulator
MSTANRLLNVLALFTMERPDWTVEEAAGELGLTLSTAYRYFKSLVEAGLVTADTPGRYTLGPAIIQYDRQLRLRDPLIASAAPIMRRLAITMGTDASVVLCRLYRTQVLCVHLESVDLPDIARDYLRVSYGRGQPMPLHRGAPSKAILAHMNFRMVKPIYDKDPEAMAAVGLGANWTEVKRNLRKLRSAGAIVTQGELEGGRQGIAYPIHSAQDLVIGSLSIVLPVTRQMPSKEATGALLAEAVQGIRASMGTLPPQEKPVKNQPAERRARVADASRA